MKFVYPKGVRILGISGSVLFLAVTIVAAWRQDSKIVTSGFLAVTLLFGYLLAVSHSTLFCDESAMTFSFAGILRGQPQPFRTLTGWYVTPDQYLPAIEFFFGEDVSISFPAHSPGLWDAFQRIRKTESERMLKEARSLMSFRPVNTKRLLASVKMTLDYVEISRFGRTRRYLWTAALAREYVDTIHNRVIKLRFPNGRVWITAYQLRKQRAVFGIISEICGRAPDFA